MRIERAMFELTAEIDLSYDAWGQVLWYDRVGSSISIESAGADGVRGTNDDVVWPPADSTHLVEVDVSRVCDL